MIFGGDIFGYYYGADQILQYLMKNDIICLLGNHEQMFLDLVDGKLDLSYLVSRYGNTYRQLMLTISKEEIDFLRKLSSFYTLHVDNLVLKFAHGSNTDTLDGRIYPDCTNLSVDDYKGIDFFFSCHTHHKMTKKIGDCTIFNPGSLGQQRDGKGCTYIIFDTESKNVLWREVFFDKDRIVKDIDLFEESDEMKNKLKEVLFR